MGHKAGDADANRSAGTDKARGLPAIAHTGAGENGIPDRGGAGLGGSRRILRRHLRSIALTTLASVALAVVYLMVAKPTYYATTALLIDPRPRKLVSGDAGQGGPDSDLALVESQVSIISSNAVLKRVVDAQELARDPEFAPPPSVGPMSTITALIRGARPPPDPEAQAVATLSQGLKVRRAQKSYVVEIEVAAASPVKAARLADAIAATYLGEQMSARADEARRAKSLIDSRLAELRDNVRQAEARVDEFMKANALVTSEGGLTPRSQVDKLETELASARAASAESNARLEQADAARHTHLRPDTLPGAITSRLVQKLREQYAQIALREAALSSQLRDRHPDLIEARSQLAEARAQIAAELGRIAESAQKDAEKDHEIAAGREREIARSLERAKENAARTSAAQIELRELQREADAGRERVRAFLGRAEESRELNEPAAIEARVVSPAAVPARPSRPLSWLVLSIGLAGGLGLGIAQALVRDRLDPSVRSLHEAALHSGLKALAAIPELELASRSARRRLEAEARRIDAAPFGALLAALSDSSGTLAPGYRQAVLRLLDKIESGTPPGRPVTVMLASPHTGAGTSATALTLGYAAALAGERVLIVDASSADPELSTVFAEKLDQDQVVVLDDKDHLARITTRDPGSGLAFLPIALADLRTLKSQQRRRLVTGLAGLAASYDLVLIDAGALLADCSGASLLAAADQVIIVARAGVTRRDALAATREALEAARDCLAGVVLTRADEPWE